MWATWEELLSLEFFVVVMLGDGSLQEKWCFQFNRFDGSCEIIVATHTFLSVGIFSSILSHYFPTATLNRCADHAF